MKRLNISLVVLVLMCVCAISCEKEPSVDEESMTGNVVADSLEWDGTKNAEIAYQLLVYSFADSDGDGIGDFQGIIDKLDYLDSLGVTALWLSPIHPAMSYHGYDVVDYAGVNPDFGTMEDFRALVAEAHERGLGGQSVP